MTTAERPKRRMRFFEFSLREMLVLFFAVAALLSIFVPGWQKQWREWKRAEPSRRLLAAAAEGDVDGAARRSPPEPTCGNSTLAITPPWTTRSRGEICPSSICSSPTGLT